MSCPAGFHLFTFFFLFDFWNEFTPHCSGWPRAPGFFQIPWLFSSGHTLVGRSLEGRQEGDWWALVFSSCHSAWLCGQGCVDSGKTTATVRWLCIGTGRTFWVLYCCLLPLWRFHTPHCVPLNLQVCRKPLFNRHPFPLSVACQDLVGAHRNVDWPGPYCSQEANVSMKRRRREKLAG